MPLSRQNDGMSEANDATLGTGCDCNRCGNRRVGHLLPNQAHPARAGRGDRHLDLRFRMGCDFDRGLSLHAKPASVTT
jgi:hypothetical protein